MNEILIDDLQKIDLRIGKIIEAEGVEDSDKLLKLIVDLGTERRQIKNFAFCLLIHSEIQ